MDEMSCLKKIFTGRSDDDLEEDSQDKDSKRKSRNLSEKKRRDQFNLLVNELSTIVSTAGGHKMDKSTVLKATISFLRNHNAVAVRSRVHEIQENWKPNFLTNEEFTHLILDAVDGFLVVLGNAGNILYISESVTSLLGYIPDDILGMTIYDLGCADEQNDLYNILSDESNEERPISFSCHLRRANYGQRQHLIYDLIHFIGYFRTNTETDSLRHPACSANAESRLVFIGTGRLQVPQLINEIHFLHPPAKTEFTSRHSLEWKFLYLDHRAPSVIGYLPFELLGTSGYDYYHIDDMDGVVGSHDALMQKGEGTSCYYRFLTKGQQWIWLQTRFYITYHHWNSKPEFIVCIHRVISHVDIIKNTIKDDTQNRLMDDTPSTLDYQNPLSRCSRNNQVETSHLKYQEQQEHQLQNHLDRSSDCTSIISTDSIMSKRFCVSQATTAKVNHCDHPPSDQSQKDQISQSIEATTISHSQPVSSPTGEEFVESSQYVAPIPVPSSAVITLIPTADHLGLFYQGSTQMQMELQKKHGDLQAIIRQQQAELRKVSEQLLMARLGIFQTPQTESTSISTSPCPYNNGTVSSTTSPLIPVSVSVAYNQLIAASNVAESNDIYNTSLPGE